MKITIILVMFDGIIKVTNLYMEPLKVKFKFGILLLVNEFNVIDIIKKDVVQ